MTKYSEQFSSYFLDSGPKLLGAIFLCGALVILGRIIQKSINNFAKNKEEMSTSTLYLLGKVAKIVSWIIGALIVLSSFGVDISALATTLGLTGFAIGFAVKDTLSNVLSGILIMIYHPFKINDRIHISGHEGTVLSIDLRYTTLEREDKIILIPNSKIFSDPVSIIKK